MPYYRGISSNTKAPKWPGLGPSAPRAHSIQHFPRPAYKASYARLHAKRKALDYETRRAICLFRLQNPKVSQAFIGGQRQFRVDRSTVSKVVSQRHKYLDEGELKHWTALFGNANIQRAKRHDKRDLFYHTTPSYYATPHLAPCVERLSSGESEPREYSGVAKSFMRESTSCAASSAAGPYQQEVPITSVSAPGSAASTVDPSLDTMQAYDTPYFKTEDYSYEAYAGDNEAYPQTVLPSIENMVLDDDDMELDEGALTPDEAAANVEGLIQYFGPITPDSESLTLAEMRDYLQQKQPLLVHAAC